MGDGANSDTMLRFVLNYNNPQFSIGRGCELMNSYSNNLALRYYLDIPGNLKKCQNLISKIYEIRETPHDKIRGKVVLQFLLNDQLARGTSRSGLSTDSVFIISNEDNLQAQYRFYEKLGRILSEDEIGSSSWKSISAICP